METGRKAYLGLLFYLHVLYIVSYCTYWVRTAIINDISSFVNSSQILQLKDKKIIKCQNVLGYHNVMKDTSWAKKLGTRGLK